MYDDDLSIFEEHGAPPLPEPDHEGFIEQAGAEIWYATYSAGPPVILLHGGLGHSGNWSYQVPALIDNGYRVVVIDSRGHGCSTRHTGPLGYKLMAADLAAVMDELGLAKASLVGWSDGAVVALTLAMQAPDRVERVFFFGCAMDPSGAIPITELSPILARCLSRHEKDYVELSATPEEFGAFADAVSHMMNTEPDYPAHELAQISVPVTIVHSEHDEFIFRDHAEYLARTIPGAGLIDLAGVSHFAPLQRPEQFNQTLLQWLGQESSPAAA